MRTSLYARKKVKAIKASHKVFSIKIRANCVVEDV